MNRKKRLTEFLDPRTLNPTLSDIAQAVKKPVERTFLPEGKQWKWRDIFYAVIEGEGARFGSYRALLCWLEAVIQQQLQQVLVEQKARLQELKAQAVSLMKAWQWAKGWAPVLESCLNQKTLNLALQLYTSQKPQFEAYPEVFDFIRQVGRQHREYLRSLEVA